MLNSELKDFDRWFSNFGRKKLGNVIEIRRFRDIHIGVGRLVGCEGLFELKQWLLNDGQPMRVNVRESNCIGIFLLLVGPVVFSFGDEQFNPILIVLVNAVHRREKLIKDDVKLGADQASLKISQ